MSTPKRSWAPHPGLVATSWILGAVATVMVFRTDDPPGRVLLGVAALVLLAAGLFSTVARPRLAADTDGLTLRGLSGRRHWTWAEVNVRLVHTRRLGRQVATIELDADPDLVVLGWFDVGTDPVEVAETIRAIRTGSG